MSSITGSRFKRFFVGFTASVLLILTVNAVAQPAQDWLRLRDYQPSENIAQLATDATMTKKARHLFYLNNPQILGRKDFSSSCPSNTEKTLVLGCYHGNQNGIYVFAVEDKELHGVEQVTAAHEMLHAAYDRLSRKERAEVDKLLTDYYRTGLTDGRVQDVMKSYASSESTNLTNEMHSIFGTEIATLPPALETYYQQYFEDRSAVIGFVEQYRGAFTRRETKIEQYDIRLSELSRQISQNEESLKSQAQQLDDSRVRAEASQDQALIDSYNAQVGQYNDLLQRTNQSIGEYNSLVAERNTIAHEELQLQKSLDSSVSPE